MHSAAEKLLFFRQFLRHPKMIGSVLPTSAAVIEALLSRVDWGQTRLFVEYGPGMGTFTRPILQRLHPEARLVAIDPNPDFVAHLQTSINDNRLCVVRASAADVEEILALRQGGERADHVLSGLPLSTLPSGMAELIVEATARALRPGGSFLIYQYSGWYIRLLEPWFGRIEKGRVWRNFPPCVVTQAYVEAEQTSTGKVQPAGELVVNHPDKKVA